MTPMAAPRDAASLPGLHWDPDQAFHTSALCAAALDSITHPFRTAPSPASPSAGTIAAASHMHPFYPCCHELLPANSAAVPQWSHATGQCVLKMVIP